MYSHCQVQVLRNKQDAVAAAVVQNSDEARKKIYIEEKQSINKWNIMILRRSEREYFVFPINVHNMVCYMR